MNASGNIDTGINANINAGSAVLVGRSRAAFRFAIVGRCHA